MTEPGTPADTAPTIPGGMAPRLALLDRLYTDVDDPTVGIDRLAVYFAEDFVDFDRNPAAPDHLSDRDAHLGFFEELKRGFTDFSHRLNVLEILPGDRAVVYWTFEGLHRNDFFGVPASGRRARTNGIDIYTLREDRITEQRHCEDVAGLMRQISSG